MGLDQYATARKGEPHKIEEEYTYTDQDGVEQKGVNEYLKWDETIQLAEWRKHPNLQGWMQDLWYTKGGEGEFNCVDLELKIEDLDLLEQSLDESALPETVGVFFGANSDDHYSEQDREFIVQARASIKQGYKVIYHSWW